jgi:hypothetical protein
MLVGAAVPGESGRLSQMQAPTIVLAAQVKPADERAAAEDMAGDGNPAHHGAICRIAMAPSTFGFRAYVARE